jgi:hypothetical protein
MSLINGGTQTGNRPGCWGRNDIYDLQSRDCRGCGFQTSCRDQIIKQTMNTQPSPVPQVNSPTHIPSYYSTFLQPTPFAQPQQVPQQFAPQAPPMFQQPQPPQQQVSVFKFQPPPVPMQAAPAFQAPRPPSVPVMQPPQPQQLQQQVLMGQQDFYGRVQDPLFYALMAPPPFRPQMEGETFMERVGKNLLLDLTSMACFHLGLALRQMFMPPSLPTQPPKTLVRSVNGQ